MPQKTHKKKQIKPVFLSTLILNLLICEGGETQDAQDTKLLFYEQFFF